MAFSLLFLAMIFTVGVAYHVLKICSPKEAAAFEGEGKLVSPFSRLELIVYFMGFQYFRSWPQLNKKWVFVAASFCSWLFFGYFFWLMAAQLNA